MSRSPSSILAITSRRYRYALLPALLSLCYWLVASLQLAPAHAQNIVGQSSSTSSTIAAARKLFVDPVTGYHWVFWYSGSAIEYASSPEGVTWTSRGTIAYNTPSFSVVSTSISGTTYVLLATEADSFDVVALRGSISGTSISFDAAVTPFDGTSSSDRYLNPSVAFDSQNRAWVVAIQDFGDVGTRFQAMAARSTNDVSSTLSFSSSNSIGTRLGAVIAVDIVSRGNSQMLLAMSGIGGTSIITYLFDGSSWSPLSLTSEIGAVPIPMAGLSVVPSDIVVDSAGNVYAGGTFSTAGGVRANGVAKWNGTSWSALGAGINGTVSSLALDNNGNLFAAGTFSSAGDVSVDNIARWNGVAWSSMGSSGVITEMVSMATDTNNNLYVIGRYGSKIARWNGTSWASLFGNLPSDAYLTFVTTDSSNNVYVINRTYGGDIHKYNGTSWSRILTSNDDTYSIAAVSPTLVYAARRWLVISRYNGTSWTNVA